MDTKSQPINFTRGVPPTEAFPIEQLQACATAVIEQHSSTILQYQPVAGFLPLREWLGQEHDSSPENVLVSNGSLQLQVFMAEILAEAGEAVLVEKPSYDRAITAFRRRGLEVVGVPLADDGFDVAALKQLLVAKKPKFFYIIPDFQNPKGITTSLKKREQLVDLAETYNFWILEDNPYRSLRYWGDAIPTVYALGSEKVLFFSSFSKVISPGLRVGYMVGPKAEVNKARKFAEDTYITPNMLSQGMVYEYCQRGWLSSNIERLKDLYRPRLEVLAAALREHLPAARWFKPEGGFFMGVDLPPGVDSALLRSRAEEAGVKLSDGAGFFSDGSGDSFLRLPFCALTRQEIEEGIRRLGSLID